MSRGAAIIAKNKKPLLNKHDAKVEVIRIDCCLIRWKSIATNNIKVRISINNPWMNGGDKG